MDNYDEVMAQHEENMRLIKASLEHSMEMDRAGIAKAEQMLEEYKTRIKEQRKYDEAKRMEMLEYCYSKGVIREVEMRIYSKKNYKSEYMEHLVDMRKYYRKEKRYHERSLAREQEMYREMFS